MVNYLVGNDVKGGRYIANGKEALTFYELDTFVKKAFIKDEQTQICRPNKYVEKMFKHYQLTLHGNTHILNFVNI